jgi:hypothetical protein
MYEYLWTSSANTDSADVHAVHIRERFSAIFDFEELVVPEGAMDLSSTT